MPFGVAALAAAHIHCNYYIASAENHVQDMMTATPDEIDDQDQQKLVARI